MEPGAVGRCPLVQRWWLNNQTRLGRGSWKGNLDWKQWLGSAPKRER